MHLTGWETVLQNHTLETAIIVKYEIFGTHVLRMQTFSYLSGGVKLILGSSMDSNSVLSLRGNINSAHPPRPNRGASTGFQ